MMMMNVVMILVSKAGNFFTAQLSDFSAKTLLAK
jgi:hypothetical protein